MKDNIFEDAILKDYLMLEDGRLQDARIWKIRGCQKMEDLEDGR